MARYLEGFTGFWFLGGNQTRLAATLARYARWPPSSACIATEP